MRDSKQRISVSIGQGMVVIRRSGQSRLTIARVLGQDNDDNGQPTVLWLDRIVHRIGESEFDDGQMVWQVSGATSSILKRGDTSTATTH